MAADRGRASLHRCLDCDGTADQWSYDHMDEDELFNEKGHPYSLDVGRYQPRCIACHRLFDRASILERTKP